LTCESCCEKKASNVTSQAPKTWVTKKEQQAAGILSQSHPVQSWVVFVCHLLLTSLAWSTVRECEQATVW
jgi:glyoxylate carboligase